MGFVQSLDASNWGMWALLTWVDLDFGTVAVWGRFLVQMSHPLIHRQKIKVAAAITLGVKDWSAFM